MFVRCNGRAILSKVCRDGWVLRRICARVRPSSASLHEDGKACHIPAHFQIALSLPSAYPLQSFSQASNIRCVCCLFMFQVACCVWLVLPLFVAVKLAAACRTVFARQAKFQHDAPLSVKQFCVMQAPPMIASLLHLHLQMLQRILDQGLCIPLCLPFLASTRVLPTHQAAAFLTSLVLPHAVCQCTLSTYPAAYARSW